MQRIATVAVAIALLVTVATAAEKIGDEKGAHKKNRIGHDKYKARIINAQKENAYWRKEEKEK